LRDLADNRSVSATAECAKRFEIVSGWIASTDPETAGQLAGVAAHFRGLLPTE
jgi:hypothetical protein